jgi:hypothetical protein
MNYLRLDARVSEVGVMSCKADKLLGSNQWRPLGGFHYLIVSTNSLISLDRSSYLVDTNGIANDEPFDCPGSTYKPEACI